MTFRTLGELVAPENEAAFRAAFAAKTRWHAAGPERAPAAAELLPWPVLDALIATGAVPAEQLRVLLNANEMPQAYYLDSHGRVRPDAIVNLAAQGATLTINNIKRLVPAIGELTTAMERALGCRTGVNAYVTFGAKSAFTAHHDDHDVLVLQVHGAKRWRSYGAPLPYPLKGGMTGSPPVCEWEDLLSPGDLLYLPRGEIHAVQPETLPSVHLTFGISEATGVDFINWLAERAESLAVLRRDLGATLQGEARAERERELAEALHRLVDAASVTEFMQAQAAQRKLRPLATLDIGGRLDPDARLVSALLRPVDLELDREGEVLLTFAQRQFRLSQLARRVLATVTAAEGGVSLAATAAALGYPPRADELIECIKHLAANALVAIAGQGAR